MDSTARIARFTLLFFLGIAGVGAHAICSPEVDACYGYAICR